MSGAKRTLKQLYDLLPYYEGDKFNIIEECTVALEKQRPLKIEKDTVMDETYSGYTYEKEIPVCPSCNNIYLTLKQPYCSQCGQKIDWSVEE